MSILINVVTPSVSWLMSDGRATNKLTGEVVSESLQKFESLNSRLYVGYIGSFELAKASLNYLREQLHGELPDLTVERVVSCLSPIMKMERSDTSFQVQFLVTGISDHSTMISAHISNEGEVSWQIPTKKIFKTKILCNSIFEDINLETFILRESACGLPPEAAIRNGMSKVIEAYSLRDKTVNNTTFFQAIR